MTKRIAAKKTRHTAKTKTSGKRGRPPIISTPEEFDAAVDAYVLKCNKLREPVTLSGLALALGYCERQALDEVAKRDGFSLPVKRAKLLVEAAYERRLAGPNAAGPIFALKNFGWKDRQEHELSGGVSLYDRIRGALAKEEGA